MSYTDQLVRLLLPLGVYSFAEGSFSLAQLQALGSTLDDLEKWQMDLQKETIVMTAENEGLQKMLSLFRGKVPAASVTNQRQAIAGFLRISGDSFTLQALNACLAACGVKCEVAETMQANSVMVRFPDTMGIPKEFALMQQIIEDILPCQLEILYVFQYCTWAQTERYGLTWGDLDQMSWHDWRHYRQ